METSLLGIENNDGNEPINEKQRQKEDLSYLLFIPKY